MLYESTYYGIVDLGNTLTHHGIKGQKHGVRRWQYENGSLTPEGYIHYGVGQGRNKAKTDKDSGPRTRKEIRKDTKIADKYANSGEYISIKLKNEADAAAKRLGYKDADDYTSKTDEGKKELTKFDPTLKDEAFYENSVAVTYEASKYAWGGASKSEVEAQLKSVGVPSTYSKLVMQSLEKNGAFDEHTTKEREAKLKDLDKLYAMKNGNDYTVEGGASVQRLTTNRHEQPGSERTYVSLTEKDKKIYRDFYATSLAAAEVYKKTGDLGYEDNDRAILSPHVYETTLSTLKTMKVAGRKAYNDAFMELYNNPKIRKEEGWQKTERGKLYTAIFGKTLKELQDKQLKQARQMFDFGLQNPESVSNTNKQFLNSLREKGYDAVQDQFSKKVDRTQGNLIVLNPNQSLKKTSNLAVKFGEWYSYEGTQSIKEAAKQEKESSAMQKQIVSALESAKRQGKDMSDVREKLADKYNVSLSTINYVYGNRKKSA